MGEKCKEKYDIQFLVVICLLILISYKLEVILDGDNDSISPRGERLS